MTYIRSVFVLYWFAHFLKFGPLPPENPRCAPEIALLNLDYISSNTISQM